MRQLIVSLAPDPGAEQLAAQLGLLPRVVTIVAQLLQPLCKAELLRKPADPDGILARSGNAPHLLAQHEHRHALFAGQWPAILGERTQLVPQVGALGIQFTHIEALLQARKVKPRQLLPAHAAISGRHAAAKETYDSSGVQCAAE